MVTLEQIEADKGVIVLKSAYGKTEIKSFIQPTRDSSGRYRGEEYVRQVDGYGNMVLSDDDKKLIGKKHFIKPSDGITIYDGFEFKLSDPIDFAKWMVYKHSPEIALSREALLSSNGCRFFVHIPEVEAAKAVGLYEKRAEAASLVQGSSFEERLKICKLLGISAGHLQPNTLAQILYKEAENKPDRIIKVYKDPNQIVRLLLMDAKSKDIIKVADGVWSYNGIPMGMTEDQSLLFLQEAKNRAIKELLQSEVYPAVADLQAAAAQKGKK